MKALTVNIIGLSKKTHHFDFRLGEEFFEKYGADLAPSGEFTAALDLDKQETFIGAVFNIEGKARLICDRSLDPFDQPVLINKKIVFKYGEEEVELSDEIVVISRDQASLDVGQYIYEFIILDMPMKRLHPRFADEEEDDGEGKVVYTSAPDEEEDPGNEVDPRWEQLKKLK